MPSYIFQFDRGEGPAWQRTRTLGDDALAKAEGRLLLESQAMLRAFSGGRITVLRDETAAVMGVWTWSEGAAVWSTPGAHPDEHLP